MSWSRADIPDLSGRRALVTGATDGLGFETALALAGKGAVVIASGRDRAKGAAALGRIRERHPEADVTFEAADLSDLEAVRAMAGRLGDAPLDILVLNAGLMALPERRLSAQGVEMQFAVNYLAHFALTGWLLEPLGRAEAARVIAVSSLAHWPARLRFDDPSFERGYNPFAAYAQSKLAMLTFAFELQRRSDAHGWGVTALAAHPGVSRTNLMASMAREGGEPTLNQRMGQAFGSLFSQDAAAGAEPQILAATAPCAPCGGYWGPDGLFELRGRPAPAKASARASDPEAGARLWALSQDLTDRPFPGDD